MRSIPVCLPFQNTTLSRPDSMECSTCWDEMRTPRCLVDWAELQALRGWRLCTPGTSQSITPYSIANPLPSHVTFSGNKQLFYGSHPRRLSEDAAITQWETYGTTSSLFSSALLSSLLRVSSLCTFSVIDRAGITWHIADPFHKGTYLLAQLLSLAYFLKKNSCWKHPLKWQNNPPPYFWGAGRTNIRPITLRVPRSGKSQISTSSGGNCRMSGACLFGSFGWKTECLQGEFHESVETSEFCLHLFRGLQRQNPNCSQHLCHVFHIISIMC